MPRGLAETFIRTLSKASLKGHKAHHVRIFKFLVAAMDPLTTEQFREAMSVTPGDTVWKSSHQINNIHALLKFCGSLILVDEEEETVRFVHHSARSFCLGNLDDSSTWHFSELDAHKEMGETIVTYLSYGI